MTSKNNFTLDITLGTNTTKCLQRQWWEFKSQHMDKVLFFKMGKFYELLEMDAHAGAKELDLQYMKGGQPHCGFLEKNFVIETPKQLELCHKKPGVEYKIVRWEICAMVTKGTLDFRFA
ncbi:hypothetical protein GUJ93_ZPchr0003g16791 [Zizania palustris]|uniref:DNA mismatch repair protein MutS-like N-terminal domain-containing protein n=1 Tax=Zizania palustris TaxID=103762 RepID=A0A8J5V708_ZIZPA|nr:hypothetical protein GUJ93_ZPchr0003g16791 [Zizania palustris]